MTAVTAPMATAQARADYVPLGGLRFLLALLVFCGHAVADYNLLSPDYRGLGFQTAGVAAFFVVSGYVILSAYVSFYRSRPGKFLTNRALRIFPPFWAVYLVSLAAFSQTAPHAFTTRVDWGQVIGNMSLIGIYLGLSEPEFIGHAWTLSIEFQFYIASIVLFLLLGRRLDDRAMTLGFVALAIAGYGLVLVTKGHYRFYGGAQYAPMFALGAATYALHRGVLGRWLGWGLVALLTALCLHAYDFYLGSVWRDNPVRIGAHGLLFGVLAVFVVLAGRTARGPKAHLDRAVGDLTYHLYLCHLLVLHLVRLAWPQAWGEPGWGGFAVALAGSVTVAAAFFLVSDLPIRRLRDRVRGRVLDRD